ncbi:lipoprotein [Streptomyces rimosus subsp. rimosus]|nr:lipoprotein [Streptomyces rimosus subsp. rimosus]
MMAAATKVTAGIVTTLALAAVAGCAAGDGNGPNGTQGGRAAPQRTAQQIKLIGDGSTAYTGAQPMQPKAERLRPGERPPQFVVFSWDGAGEDSQKLFSHFRAVGKKYDARMTYFLSGVYLLPGNKKEVYQPPKHSPGASDIGFNDVKGVRATVEQMRGAWMDGNEIGTHFNGHFCGANGGVGTWSPEEWKSEIRQAEAFVKSWKTNTGLKSEKPLPFDYSKELVGGRAPCLEGQRNLIPAAKAMGFRYDSSSVGGRQVWPKQIDGIWDFPLQQIPVPGRSFETLSMDYNFLANQSGTTRGNPAMHATWGKQMRDGLVAAFERADKGNRAPLFVGNHFESWNGGTYMRAVEDAIKTICPREGVRCVTFKQLADWLDAQDPRVLDKLRALPVGETPKGGWKSYLTAPSAKPGAPGGPAGSAGPAKPARKDAE